jgi:hypothetical protein
LEGHIPATTIGDGGSREIAVAVSLANLQPLTVWAKTAAVSPINDDIAENMTQELLHRIAIIVDPGLPLGLVANTVGTIAVGLGAAEQGFGNTTLVDRNGRQIKNSADRPVPVLQAPPEAIRATMLKALPAVPNCIVVAFPRFARSLHAFEDYQARFSEIDLAEETIEGLGLAGPEKWVKSLTGNLKLLR